MQTELVRPKSRTDNRPHPLWMRLLTVFCAVLLGIASTVQVCHAHDDLSNQASASAVGSAVSGNGQPSRESSGSTVNCPLCVAMHSALPATHSLLQVSVLKVQTAVVRTDERSLPFLWRSQLASRPPPAASPIA